MEKIKYKTINEIVESEEFPFTKGQFRTLLMKRKENGLDNCVRKIGKRLYIRIDLFYEWIESNQE